MLSCFCFRGFKKTNLRGPYSLVHLPFVSMYAPDGRTEVLSARSPLQTGNKKGATETGHLFFPLSLYVLCFCLCAWVAWFERDMKSTFLFCLPHVALNGSHYVCF